MALNEAIGELTREVDRKVHETNERVANHVEKDESGNVVSVTEFFATEVQVRKLVRESVEAHAVEILDEVIATVFADLQNKKF